jgi:hypothetical protein
MIFHDVSGMAENATSSGTVMFRQKQKNHVA